MRNQSAAATVSVVAVVLGAVGCGQGAPEGGEAVRESASYVVLDRSAREAGVRLEGVSAADAILPIELATNARIHLESPAGAVPLELHPGEVVYVRGRDARIDRGELDVDVARDRVAVLGSAAAAAALAEQIGGVVDARDGRFVVVGPEALVGLARAAMPDGLDEVVPVLPDDAAGRPAFVGGISAELAPIDRGMMRASASVVPAFDLTAFVNERLALPPDQLLPRVVDCPDPVVGTWVSREHYPEYGDWYRFELVIRRDARDSSGLVGSIGSRSWAGGGEVNLPIACGAADGARSGVEFDWTVRMSATGSVEGSSVSFGGRSVHVEGTRCGPRFAATHYALDQFSGELVEGGRFLRAVNNDGGRSLGDPHLFRRISCE